MIRVQQTNVLIDGECNAVLCDFGRAKIFGDDYYSTNSFSGSVTPYMAPELLPEKEEDESGVEIDVDKLFTTHSDMYAFGILAFEVRKCLS